MTVQTVRQAIDDPTSLQMLFSDPRLAQRQLHVSRSDNYT